MLKLTLNTVILALQNIKWCDMFSSMLEGTHTLLSVLILCAGP
jgi:hypothetical protein